LQQAGDAPYLTVKEPTLTAHVLQSFEFTDRDRVIAQSFGNLGKRDRREIRVRHKASEDRILRLPPEAAIMLRPTLGHLAEDGRAAGLAEPARERGTPLRDHAR